jgi:hypothetical protein
MCIYQLIPNLGLDESRDYPTIAIKLKVLSAILKCFGLGSSLILMVRSSFPVVGISFYDQGLTLHCGISLITGGKVVDQDSEVSSTV